MCTHFFPLVVEFAVSAGETLGSGAVRSGAALSEIAGSCSPAATICAFWGCIVSGLVRSMIRCVVMEDELLHTTKVVGAHVLEKVDRWLTASLSFLLNWPHDRL